MTRKVGHNETDLKIAIALGTGMSVERAAEYVGVSPNTVRAHLDTNRQWIMGAKSEVESALAVNTSKQVEKARKSHEENIKDLFGRAFQLTMKAIEKAEEKGDAITLAELMEIHNKITVWASKFAASEAPKRLEVGGSVDNVHYLSDEFFDRVTAFMNKHQNLLPAAEPRVIDAVVVEPTP